MTEIKTISVVVPFYNEENIIESRVKKIHKYLSKNFNKFELILVNDGSNDLSETKLRCILSNLSHTKFLTSKVNKGRGNALQKGLAVSNSKIIGYLDADLEIGIENIPNAVKSLSQNDIAIASKFLQKSDVSAPLFRKISSLVYNKVVNIVLRTNVSDHQAGFKFFKKNVIKKLLPLTKEDGWLWDIEVLYLAKKMNYTVIELPVRVRYGYRKFRPTFISDFLKMPFFIFELKRKVDKRLYEKK